MSVKNFIIWAASSCLFCWAQLGGVNKKQSPQILLFTCQYGSGHKMAAQGIVERLPNISFKVVDIYAGPLREIDPLKKGGCDLNFEKIYNQMAKNENNRLLNLASKIAPSALLWQRGRIERLLETYVANERPDMIISCVPLLNSMLLNVAAGLDIPFLVISTDIDISWFVWGFDRIDFKPDRKKFRVTFPYSEKYLKKRNAFPTWLQNSIEYNFGYPTRPSFSQTADESTLDNIRKKYSIADDENVILIMMGSNGAKAALAYAKLLIEMSEDEIKRIDNRKMNVLALCGDIGRKENLELMRRLNALNLSCRKKNNLVRIQAIPKTSKIAELVSLPNLRAVISKPGGSTVNEMICKKVPMVYHIQGVPLDWERGNMEYGEVRGFGRHLYLSKRANRKNRENLIRTLRHVFSLRRSFNRAYEPEIDFSANLKRAISEMI